MSENARTNRLAHETSPYLLQHATNPVDWYPWGPQALELAKENDKPIFLSIGYSACHWCHVMEHESFEDPATAEVMNELFINIKVDREERPDLDSIYMNAVQLMVGHGGWPMSVWLTPDLKPFYGGTYFPPTPKHHLPGFKDVCKSIADAYHQRRGEIDGVTESLLAKLQEIETLGISSNLPDEQVLLNACQKIERGLDKTFGGMAGMGDGPKFPHAVEMRLLFRGAKRAENPELALGASFSLQQMILGGIYDHLGGGFHRYSTDRRWLVPHFEKMLYDNALISQALVEAYQFTDQEIYRRAAMETLEYVQREMTDPAGGFYSTQDADSEGEEGKFFVWSEEEIDEILGADQAAIFKMCYNVSSQGNWEGKNILHLSKPIRLLAPELETDVESLENQLLVCRRKLFAHREKRIKPGRDEKILTAWNGLMIESFAVAGLAFDRADFILQAVASAEFAWNTLRDEKGRLYRTCKNGRAHLNGYLEDYSFLANAYVSLYEATFNEIWFERAQALCQIMIDQFWDDQAGGFFFTSHDHEELIVRGKVPHDNATPSGNAMAVTVLARLSALTGGAYQVHIERTLAAFAHQMTRVPMASGQMLIALDLFLGPTVEFALVGPAEGNSNDQSEQTLDPLIQVQRAIGQRFLPKKVLAGGRGDTDASSVGLLHHRSSRENQVTLYVCQKFQCEQPVVGLSACLDKVREFS